MSGPSFLAWFRFFLVNNNPKRARRLAKREMSRPIPF